MAAALKRWGKVLLVGYVLGCLVGGVLLAEFSLRLPRMHVTAAEGSLFRDRMRDQFHAQVEDVSVTAADGAVLRAWYVQPPKSNGEAVVILHGIGGSRIDDAGFGDMFLAEGYAVLMPDSRAHGDSGGRVMTYGILERDDVRRWVSWVRGREGGCTYLLGESLGAAIGLQAAAVTPQLCAVAVEDPYATFRTIGYERLGRETRVGAWFWRTLGAPIVEVAIVYSRVRYRVYLPDAEPRAAVADGHVPALLIAGTVDRNIPMHHAVELEGVCGARCGLWVVNGADHGGASGVDHAGFVGRVVGWFKGHDGR